MLDLLLSHWYCSNSVINYRFVLTDVMRQMFAVNPDVYSIKTCCVSVSVMYRETELLPNIHTDVLCGGLRSALKAGPHAKTKNENNNYYIRAAALRCGDIT